MTRSLHLHWIHPSDPPDAFPDPERALLTPDGLLAAGGDLSPARLLAAYRRGIFPWYEEGQPILWWSPDPRAVFFPDRLHVSRSLRKRLRSGRYEVSIDTDFEGVIDGCAAPRGDDYDDDATWITADMRGAYLRLHELGHTHSVEVWHEDRLIGGVYGVALGRMFFGESMFSRESDASKVALVRLAEELRTRGFGLIDCQLVTGHLERLGSIPLPRPEFVSLVGQLTAGPAPPPGLWTCARTHTVAP